MRLLKEIRSLIGNYHVKSGVYHYHRDEHHQAIEFLTKALRDETGLSDADRANARYYLTLCRIERASRLQADGNPGAAVEELELAAEASPGFPDVHFRIAELLERLGRSEQAGERYREAIRHNPSYLEAHVALGVCLLKRGRPDEAEEAFHEARRVQLEQVQRPFEEGLSLLRAGDHERAAERMNAAFRSEPRLTDELLRKALELLRAEEHGRALAELDRAIELSPKYPDLHNFRGIALCALERLDEAFRAFALSSELSPDYLVPRLNLAFARVRAGQYREAEAELEAILEIDPRDPVAGAKLEELRTGRPPERRLPASKGGPK
jgi:Tfp pilus assembly protein PilF